MAETAPAHDDLIALAASAYGAGDLALALQRAEAALEGGSDKPVACNLLGLIAFASGQTAVAVSRLREAADLDPGNAEYRNNLGVVQHALDDLAGARLSFEQALAIDPRFAQAANNLGSVLEKVGDDGAAVGLYRRALDADPAYVEARDNLVLVCARVAPQWHFPMMADRARNCAYEAALRRSAAGKRVLDIGSGSGLLAMMAARAGAATVDTCEMQPVVAATAERIVNANGLAHAIRVHAKRSDQLQPGADLALPAEVLVTETFSSGLFSERALLAVEDAHGRLVADDAQVIPRRIAAVGYLIGGSMVEDHLFASSSSGFDLSGFDGLASPRLGLHLDRVPHDVLSDDFELFGFDLASPPFPAARRAFEVEAIAAGRCVAVAQWLRLELDAETTYENRPHGDAAANGWMHVVYRLARPVDLRRGDRLRLTAAHNKIEMTVGLTV